MVSFFRNLTPFTSRLGEIFRLRFLLLGTAGVAVGVLLSAFISAGDIYDYQDSVDGAHLPDVDAIVVLAGGRGRIAFAGDIWYRYWELHQPYSLMETSYKTSRVDPPKRLPILYVSGMGHQANWNVLARQMRRGVFGVLQPQRVVLETESTNTVENARWVARHAHQKKWRRILLVTSRYHMLRARYIFAGVLAELDHPVEVETLSVYQEPFEPGEWRSAVHGVQVTLLEYLKWVYCKAFWKP